MAFDTWITLNFKKLEEETKGLGFSQDDLNRLASKNYPKGLGLGKCANIPIFNSGAHGNAVKQAGPAVDENGALNNGIGAPDVVAPIPPDGDDRTVVVNGATTGAGQSSEKASDWRKYLGR